MFARYDQDLSPYFQQIRAIERERSRERRRARRESFRTLLAMIGVRLKA